MRPDKDRRGTVLTHGLLHVVPQFSLNEVFAVFWQNKSQAAREQSQSRQLGQKTSAAFLTVNRENCRNGSPVICSVHWCPCVSPDSSVDVPLPWKRSKKEMNNNQKLEHMRFTAYGSSRGTPEAHLCSRSHLVLGFYQRVNGSFTCRSINHHPPDLKTHESSMSPHLDSCASEKSLRHRSLR